MAVTGAGDRDHSVQRLRPRGPLSTELLRRLVTDPQPLPGLRHTARAVAAGTSSTLAADDVQLSLAVIYELHYRGFSDVDEHWEWHPDLVAAAGELEAVFERDLRDLVAPRLPVTPVAPFEVAEALAEMVRNDDSPSMSKHLARQGTHAQYAEFLAHRSIYHLREADPHSWAIPRLAGPVKAALVEIQSDEYGGGRADWMHSTLFGTSMRGLGLDDSYGRYLNDVPSTTLAWANTMTLFGLHRRWRGAAVGHLAALEMTSSLPNRRYGNGLRRLGFDADTTRFFDEHVEADAVHEQIAAHDLACRLARAEPPLVADILFGAAAALATDGLLAEELLAAWANGGSLLRGGPLSATIGARLSPSALLIPNSLA
jgi:Iron-containing redox enzyme